MTNQHSILDEVESQKKVVLFSKFSILLTSMIFTPLFGGILYVENLNITGQKNKIIGTYITIVICNFFALVPFLGFGNQFSYFNLFQPTMYINHLAVALLMLFPLWNKQFKNSAKVYLFNPLTNSYFEDSTLTDLPNPSY